jgi:hypothetical protein
VTPAKKVHVVVLIERFMVVIGFLLLWFVWFVVCCVQRTTYKQREKMKNEKHCRHLLVPECSRYLGIPRLVYD